MKKINLFILIIIFSLNCKLLLADDFINWKKQFKKYAIEEGISKKTVELLINNSKFLPNVIKYDRYQPEFYEDTKTYITKRTSNNKLKQGISLYKKENEIINKISNEYGVNKNLLLALMGIETNFGNYLGKMDIVSSLATLSFDKRRSEFFTSELIILLKLVDNQIVDPNLLYGSWAGAFGNFQFMPSTIDTYAIDYDKNDAVELKKIDDSFASAANYLNKLGWNNNTPCFYKIDLSKNIPVKYLNTSAKKLINKKKISFFKKYIVKSEFLDKYDNLYASIITPDVDIVENTNRYSPAYIVFSNYDLILKWNRSLRFALAVCTLKDKFNDKL